MPVLEQSPDRGDSGSTAAFREDCLAMGKTILEALTEIMEDLLAYGDLLEMPIDGEGVTKANLVYLAPLVFVRRRSGRLLLVGVSQEIVRPDPNWQDLIQHRGYTRYVEAENAEAALDVLSEFGCYEIIESRWMQAPPISTPAELVQLWMNRLSAAGSSGAIPDLQILDGEKPARYYKGRWTSPAATLTGNYVARRPQRYGADLWCFVTLEKGKPQRFVDLPGPRSVWRGADEAWHLQAALDATVGRPQRAETVALSDQRHRTLIRLFAPLPSWAHRRFDAVGEREDGNGCLQSFSFEGTEAAEEAIFLEKHLWMQTIGDVKETGQRTSSDASV